MLRERAGSESVTVEVPEGATVRDAVDAVARDPRTGRRDGAHVRRDGRQSRVRRPGRPARRGRRAGADPAGQRGRNRGSHRSRIRDRRGLRAVHGAGRQPRARHAELRRPAGHAAAARGAGPRADGVPRERAVPEPGRHRAGRLPHGDARRHDGAGGDHAARPRLLHADAGAEGQLPAARAAGPPRVRRPRRAHGQVRRVPRGLAGRRRGQPRRDRHRDRARREARGAASDHVGRACARDGRSAFRSSAGRAWSAARRRARS